jgi:hypothetical protein
VEGKDSPGSDEEIAYMPFRPTLLRLSMGMLFLLVAMAVPVRADECYFMLLFAAQTVPTRAKFSHTFATFVRATGSGPCLESYDLQWHTISWLPPSMTVHPYAPRPECGFNFDLHTTVRHSLCAGARVSLWGPFQIQPCVYWSSLRQKAHLESGTVRYKAIDIGFRADRVADCIHAVNRIVYPERLNILDPLYGEPATYVILQEFRPYLINECCKHYWLCAPLGLNCYPIIYRNMEKPRSGPVCGGVSTFLGRQPPAIPSFGPPISCMP